MVDYLMTGSYWPLVYKYWPANYWVGLVVGKIPATLRARSLAATLEERDLRVTLRARSLAATPEEK